MNETYELLIHADDTIKRNSKALLEASMKVGLEVHTEGLSIQFCVVTKIYGKMTMYRLLMCLLKKWQNSKYLETAITSSHEEIKTEKISLE
jgi:hypothetical protein